MEQTECYLVWWSARGQARFADPRLWPEDVSAWREVRRRPGVRRRVMDAEVRSLVEKTIRDQALRRGGRCVTVGVGPTSAAAVLEFPLGRFWFRADGLLQAVRQITTRRAFRAGLWPARESVLALRGGWAEVADDAMEAAIAAVKRCEDY